jgi:recombinational DNA repair protein RecT
METENTSKGILPESYMDAVRGYFTLSYGESEGEKKFKQQWSHFVATIKASDQLQKCSHLSLLSVIKQIAEEQLDISPALAEQEAYVIPRKGQAVLSISVTGMINRWVKSGQIQFMISSDVIYKKEAEDGKVQIVNGVVVRHEADPIYRASTPPSSNDEILGAYAFFETPDGKQLCSYVDRANIMYRRSKSDLFSNIPGKSAWTDNFVGMAKKCAIRAAAKQFFKGTSTFDTEIDEPMESIATFTPSTETDLPI